MAKHFSHDHKLHKFEIEKSKEEDNICSACESKIVEGTAYKCGEEDQECWFYLHERCFELPRETHHASHPGHALALFSVPPNAYESFLCDGCGDPGSGFVYHCPVPECDYDLHVKCCLGLASESASRGHAHPLALVYSVPDESLCGACRSGLSGRSWAYFCKECNYGEHLGCEFLDPEEEEEEEESKNEGQEEEEEEGISENEGQEEEEEEEGDDEMVMIRRGDLRKLHKLLSSKDSLIATYQMMTMRMQHRQMFMANKNLFHL